MSKTISKSLHEMESDLKLDKNIFNCKFKLSPDCSGKGYIVGKKERKCSPCINYEIRQKEEMEKNR